MATSEDRRSFHASIVQDIKIENFSIPYICEEKLISFVPLTPEYYEFFMVKVHPVGMNSESKDHISVVICKVGHDFYLSPVKEHYNLNWTLSLIDINGDGRYYQSLATENAVDYLYVFELPFFLKRSQILEKADELLSEDVLTVRCELSYEYFLDSKVKELASEDWLAETIKPFDDLIAPKDCLKWGGYITGKNTLEDRESHLLMKDILEMLDTLFAIRRYGILSSDFITFWKSKLVSTDCVDEVRRTYMFCNPIFKTYTRLKIKLFEIVDDWLLRGKHPNTDEDFDDVYFIQPPGEKLRHLMHMWNIYFDPDNQRLVSQPLSYIGWYPILVGNLKPDDQGAPSEPLKGTDYVSSVEEAVTSVLDNEDSDNGNVSSNDISTGDLFFENVPSGLCNLKLDDRESLSGTFKGMDCGPSAEEAAAKSVWDNGDSNNGDISSTNVNSNDPCFEKLPSVLGNLKLDDQGSPSGPFKGGPSVTEKVMSVLDNGNSDNGDVSSTDVSSDYPYFEKLPSVLGNFESENQNCDFMPLLTHKWDSPFVKKLQDVLRMDHDLDMIFPEILETEDLVLRNLLEDLHIDKNVLYFFIQTNDGVPFQIPTKFLHFDEVRVSLGSKLVSTSAVFENMLKVPMQEKIKNWAILHDIDSATFINLLHFLQMGDIKYSSLPEVIDLYEVADQYAVEGLMRKCAERLESYFNPDNIDDLEQLAVLHSDDYLVELVNVFKQRLTVCARNNDEENNLDESVWNTAVEKESMPEFWFDFYQ